MRVGARTGPALIQIKATDVGHDTQTVQPSATADRQRLQCSDLYMTEPLNRTEPAARATSTRRDELIVFLLIAALIWPITTVGVVGGYGFAVWMYQIIAGPPGPPRR